jgi:AcrR family transcriptional regulator
VGAAPAAPPARPVRAHRVRPGPAARPAPGTGGGPIATTKGSPSSRRSRARRGEGELLRDEILAAAEQLLIDTGDERRVSVRAVADAVGVTPPSIYLHFADKETLLNEVCQQHFTTLDERMVAAAAPFADDPLESLHARGMAYVRFGLENPEHYRILFMATGKGHRHDDSDDVARSAALGHMVEAVAVAMEAGLLRLGDPKRTTIGLWATAHGLTSLLIAKPGFPWGDVIQLADQVLYGHMTGLLAPGVAESNPRIAAVLAGDPRPG